MTKIQLPKSANNSMSHCSLLPKTFAQIGSAHSLCPSNGTKCTNSAPSASSSAFSPSIYMGSGYRSVAFGTWAVGDASRCFEGRRRGKSATALENGRMGRTAMMTKEEEENEEEKEEGGGGGGKRKKGEKGGEGRREEKRQKKGEEEEEAERKEERKERRKEEGEKRRKGKEREGRKRNGEKEKGGRGKGGAKRDQSDSSSIAPSTNRSRSPNNRRSVPTSNHHHHSSPNLSRSLCDISAHRRKTMQMAVMRRRESDLYSSSEYVRHNNGTNEREMTDNLHKKEKVAMSHAEASLCPSSASPSAASVAFHRNNGGCSLEAIFVPPFRCPVPLSPCPSHISCPPVQRPFRRLLPQQHNHWSPHSLCQSPHQFSFVIDPLAKEMPRMRTKSLDNGQKLSLGAPMRRRKDRICEAVPGKEQQMRNVPGSRKSVICENDQLSTGGAESRLEAAKNFLRRFYNHSTLRLTGRRRRGNGTKRGDADKGTEPSLMYSSALGPFFEMRKPQPGEVPFLPYNIHYTIESTDEASGASDDEADSAAAAVRRPLRPVSPQSEWSCTPTCSSVTVTTSPNTTALTTRKDKTNRSSSCLVNKTNRPIAADDPFETYLHQQQLVLTRSAADCLPLLSFVSSVPQIAPSSPTSLQHFVVSSPLHHQQSATDSLLNETVATTPSAGYGSLKSSSDSSEGRRDNDGRKMPRRMGSAEKRFADWNELFQYLKREIMEMNVRDAQILRRLEGIQFELNGVRQISAQQRR